MSESLAHRRAPDEADSAASGKPAVDAAATAAVMAAIARFEASTQGDGVAIELERLRANLLDIVAGFGAVRTAVSALNAECERRGLAAPNGVRVDHIVERLHGSFNELLDTLSGVPAERSHPGDSRLGDAATEPQDLGDHEPVAACGAATGDVAQSDATAQAARGTDIADRVPTVSNIVGSPKDVAAVPAADAVTVSMLEAMVSRMRDAAPLPRDPFAPITALSDEEKIALFS